MIWDYRKREKNSKVKKPKSTKVFTDIHFCFIMWKLISKWQILKKGMNVKLSNEDIIKVHLGFLESYWHLSVLELSSRTKRTSNSGKDQSLQNPNTVSKKLIAVRWSIHTIASIHHKENFTIPISWTPLNHTKKQQVTIKLNNCAITNM